MATTSGYLRWRLPLSATHFLVVSFSVLILLMLLTFQQQTTVEAKHHRRFSCSAVSSSSSSSSSSTFFDRCPVHKHKICGSDGKLYPSRCHLRRAACEGNTIIRPAHPDQCLKDEEREAEQELERAEKDSAAAAADDQQKTNTVYGQDELQTAVDKQQQPDVVFSSKPAKIALSSSSSAIPVDVEEDEDRGGNDIEGLKAKQTSATSTAHPLDYSEEDECRPKDYDLMKEKVLNKINDVSLLFTRLDENNDGQITLNELWKHSMLYKAPDSSCLLTDLVQHEDANDDEKLDYSEFQAAFNKLFSVVMVSLDESLAVNRIEAHLGDNVEIRCDITGEPQRPAIKWYRHGVDLAALSLPYIKVFTDGSLYLTDLALSFAGNYSCQAMNNPTVKQTHVVHVIVPPIVEVTPRFQWAPIGGVASFECRYETFDEDTEVVWLKNDEQLLVDGGGSGSGGGGSGKVTILNNGTRLQVAALEQTDTGAYTCRVGPRGGGGGSRRGSRGNFGQSVASLLVQDETVEAASSETRPQRLWIFHANGLSIYEGICGQPVHEIDARDIVYQNSVTLCGGGNGNGNEQAGSCEWSEDVVVLHDRLFIAQPALNRIIVFQASQLSVLQVIATDARPRRLWASEKDAGDQIWVLCDGNSASSGGADNGNYLYEESSWAASQQSDSAGGGWSPVNSADSSSAADSSSSRYDFLSEKYLKNRKTIQVVRLYDQQSSEKSSADGGGGGRRSRRQADVIHLQPVDGHFDLVYDLFMPDHYESIFRSGAGQVDETSSSSSSSSFGDQSHHQQRQQQQQNQLRAVMQASPFAYATHWEERSLVKISLQRLEYLQSIRLADCQPISAAIITRRGGGLVAVQCQTPVTHQLNGQLILDQVTDAILTHNQHLNAHQSYLSPDHRYLVNILHERLMNTGGGGNVSFSSSTASPSSNTSTIIVQRISDNGVEFLYDVRTSLDIVSCSFVWKNGAYDLVLASGTRNREDLLYLSLADGHVELISGIGRPTEGYHRGLALSTKNRVLSVTATESVFTVDLNTNRILCESSKHFAKPHTLAWTN